MQSLYDFLTHGSSIFLWSSKFFSKKMKLFVEGRKNVIPELKEKISPNDKTIWFHCASLGEFEQGLPIINSIKEEYNHHKIVITFYSPSGYEVKKNDPVADAIVYLPIDTKKNVREFLEAVHPSLAIFVKYEFWPNYLIELKKLNIPTLLVSGLFRKNQVFFKSHGSFMRRALQTFDHFFVQDANSEKLLANIGFQNVTISGDTRFDRVSHQIENDNSLDFIEQFLGDTLCVVCGSTWPEDEDVIVPFIKESPDNVKFIFAPHIIEEEAIEKLREKLELPSVLFSEKSHTSTSDAKVFIVDTIGFLTKIYSYAQIAYVGGGMGNSGLHNILEAATFGVPIIIGQNFDKFPEAKRLQQLAGLFAVSNSEEFKEIMQKLLSDEKFRNQTGMICGHFVNSNTGATKIIM
ncbi:MAG: 3-deoxy-D-manno-octulosonic acid transferase, partial [Croceitalea sp.]|nr:3-deoxy-D-manno-octulosonic acid transferase [Croceitalea sp.]